MLFQNNHEQNVCKPVQIKYLFVLTSLLIIAILLRFMTLNQVYYTDDMVIMKIVDNNYFFAPANVNPHPPLTNIFLLLATALFGVREWTFRLPAFFFSIATISVTYFFAKKYYDSKTALWAVAILTFSAWHIYSAGTNIGGDGIPAFFLLLASLIFLHYQEKAEIRYQYITGLFVGLAVLVKESALIMFGIFFIFFFFQKLPLKVLIKKMTGIFLGFATIWACFIILDAMVNNFAATQGILGIMFRAGIEKSGYIAPTFFHYLFSWIKILLWIGPCIIFLFFLELFSEKEGSNFSGKAALRHLKEYSFIYSIIYGLFFLFYISPVFDKSRYLLVLAPFLAIIAGNYLSRKHWTKRNISIIIVTTVFFFTLFLFLNSQRNIISYEQPEKILTLIKQGSFNFNLGIISETGNPGLVLNARVLVLAYVISFFALILFFVTRKNERKQCLFFSLFIAVVFAYSLFLTQEFIFHTTSPDYSESSRELVAYIKEHNLPEPIYLFKNPSLVLYLQDEYTEFYSFDTIQNSDEQIHYIESLLKEKGGTILFINLPFVNKEGQLWQLINQYCMKEYIVEDKEMEVGYILICTSEEKSKEESLQEKM